MTGLGFSGKFFEHGGKQFALLSVRMKKLRKKCENSQIIDNIAIHLDEKVANKSHYLSHYSNMVLAIHGLPADVPVNKINEDTIVAFGFVGSKDPMTATKLKCFRNSDLIIDNLRKHVETKQLVAY